MKKVILIILLLVILGGIGYMFFHQKENSFTIDDSEEVILPTPNLQMKKWEWVSSLQNGTSIDPEGDKKFLLKFETDGTFSSSTDCNNLTGRYTTVTNSIVFENIASTRMYCEGSQENVFSGILENIEAYNFTPQGELVFTLKAGTGSVTFK